MTAGIYMIEHIESGRRYIGRSVDIEMRWHQHRSDAKNRRTNNPVHNAIRKYGAKAFNWKILVTAPARLQARLEEQFILDWGTLKPNGYNLGGTEGGFPSRDLINTMDPDERARWESVMARAARAGHEALRELRQDPEYEAEFLKIKSAASTKREARIRERRAIDPEYDAKTRERRSIASKKNPKGNPEKASATFRDRMKDPEYAARIRANRTAAGGKQWEKQREKERLMHEALRKCLSS